MTFTPAQPRTPTAIGSVVIILKDRPAMESQPASKTVSYDVAVLDQDGRRMDVPQDTGNLAPHLTQAQINALIQFMTDMRAKAEAELL
jgi:hypothetical protein